MEGFNTVPKVALVKAYNTGNDYEDVFISGIPEWVEISDEELKLLQNYMWKFTDYNSKYAYQLIIFPDNQKEIIELTLNKIRAEVKKLELERQKQAEKRKKKAATKIDKEKKLYEKLKEKYEDNKTD